MTGTLPTRSKIYGKSGSPHEWFQMTRGCSPSPRLDLRLTRVYLTVLITVLVKEVGVTVSSGGSGGSFGG